MILLDALIDIGRKVSYPPKNWVLSSGEMQLSCQWRDYECRYIAMYLTPKGSSQVEGPFLLDVLAWLAQQKPNALTDSSWQIRSIEDQPPPPADNLQRILKTAVNDMRIHLKNKYPEAANWLKTEGQHEMESIALSALPPIQALITEALRKQEFLLRQKGQ